MAETVCELHCMKVHVFESEEDRAAAAEAGLIGPNDLVITPEPGTVDDAMSDSSVNPVQNRVIKQYVDSAISAAIAALE